MKKNCFVWYHNLNGVGSLSKNIFEKEKFEESDKNA